MNAQIPPLWGFNVPSGFDAADCNDVSRFPFGYEHPATVRYQQVYNASAFSVLPPGGAFLSWVNFRGDCSSSFEPLVTNVQIFASTTLKRAGELGVQFAENVGQDETQIHQGEDYVPPGNYGFPLCPNPAPTGNPIILDTPFYYDPARGNLLLEFRVSGVAPWPVEWLPPWWPAGEGLPYNKLDAHREPGGVMSRAAALSETATTAEVVDASGIWTRFLFAPTPRLEVTTETDAVVLSWPRAPQSFQLQWRSESSSAIPWQNYVGDVSILGWYNYVRVTKESLTARRYYRLFLNTTQPLPAAPASAGVEIDPAND